jgi:hypothetical protein
MQYLQSQPFSVGLASKKFSEGWDRIFAKKPAEAAVEPAKKPEPEHQEAIKSQG